MAIFRILFGGLLFFVSLSLKDEGWWGMEERGRGENGEDAEEER